MSEETKTGAEWVAEASALLAELTHKDLLTRVGGIERAASAFGTAAEMETAIGRLAAELNLPRDMKPEHLPGAVRRVVDAAPREHEPGRAAERLFASLLDRLDALKAKEASPEGDRYVRAAEFGSRTRVCSRMLWGELRALPKNHPARQVPPLVAEGGEFLVLGPADAPNGWYALGAIRDLTAAAVAKDKADKEDAAAEARREEERWRQREANERRAALAANPEGMLLRIEELERQLAERQ